MAKLGSKKDIPILRKRRKINCATQHYSTKLFIDIKTIEHSR
jgi:hypothetical protein